MALVIATGCHVSFTVVGGRGWLRLSAWENRCDAFDAYVKVLQGYIKK